jgi:hypothetical protein
MSETLREVPMYLIDPGTASPDGEFCFELQARANAGRTVRFALNTSDSLMLKEALVKYFQVPR